MSTLAILRRERHARARAANTSSAQGGDSFPTSVSVGSGDALSGSRRSTLPPLASTQKQGKQLAHVTSGSGGELPKEDSHKEEEHQPSVASDGKTFVEAFLKKENMSAAHSLHDIALSIVSGFASNERRREDEYKHLDRVACAIQRDLTSVHARARFPLGARVLHSNHGEGTVVEHMDDSRIRCCFDSGVEQLYKQAAIDTKVTRVCPQPETPRSAAAATQVAAKTNEQGSGDGGPVLDDLDDVTIEISGTRA